MATEKKQGSAKFIIVLVIALLVGVIVFFVGLFSILGDKGAKGSKDTSVYQTTVQANVEAPNLTTSYYVDMEGSTIIVTETEPITTQTPQGSGQQDTTQQGNSDTQGETNIVEYYEQLSPNGENKLSDNPDNEFIALVSEKHDVNPELLVAIYSVPDTGVNYVLEFAGSRDKNGNIIKSPDTLSKLYYIDLDRNIKVATRSGIGNVGVDAGEGLFTISLVQKLVMTQYPDYFTGLD